MTRRHSPRHASRHGAPSAQGAASRVSIGTIVACLLAATALLALRVWCANRVGIYMWSYAGQLDDALLVRYAQPDHFTNPDWLSMVKVMGFPMFLLLVRASRLTFATVIALLWGLAAALVGGIVRTLAPRHPWWALAAYAATLFHPIGFSPDSGTRLYRNTVMAPLYIAVLALMVLLVLHALEGRGAAWMLADGLALAVMVTAAYFMKEDGSWLLACLALADLAALVCAWCVRRLWGSVPTGRHGTTSRAGITAAASHAGASQAGASHAGASARDAIRRPAVLALVVAIVLPWGVLAGATAVYESVNERAFGVRGMETRMSGQLGGFAERLYLIDAEGRSSYVWAPADAVAKAFDASPTLRSHPEFRDQLINHPMTLGTLYSNPVKGDIITWDIRYALLTSGLWQSDGQVDALFRQVNAELDAAFADGSLPRDTQRIHLLASVGGMTRDDLRTVLDGAMRSLYSQVVLDDFSPGGRVGDVLDPTAASQAADLANTPYLVDYSTSGIDYDAVNRWIGRLVRVFRVLNIALAALALTCVVWGIVRFVRRHRRRRGADDADSGGADALTPEAVADAWHATASWWIIVVCFGLAVGLNVGLEWFEMGAEPHYAAYLTYFYDLPAIAVLVLLYAVSLAYALRRFDARHASANS